MSYSAFGSVFSNDSQDCNSCSNSYSMMNNGSQQPMPQVRTLPSNRSNHQQAPPSNNSAKQINATKSELEKVVLEAVAKNNNITQKNNNVNSVSKTSNGVNLKTRLSNELTEGTRLTTSILLQSIQTAFVLIVALAWNKAIGEYLQRYIRVNEGSRSSYFYYAITVTFIFVIFVRVFNTKIKPLDYEEVEIELAEK